MPRLGAWLLASGLLIATTPSLAQGVAGAPTLTADAARTAIAKVLAGASSATPWPSAALLYSLGGVAALTSAAFAIRCRSRRRVAVSPPPRYRPSPAGSMALPGLTEAERLWPQEPELAMETLYRGLLARLTADYRLQILPGLTEPEVLEQVATLRLSGVEDYTRRLLDHWLRLRYGHETPTPAAWAALCAGWRHLFPVDAT